MIIHIADVPNLTSEGKLFKGCKDNIPDEPIAVACPVALQAQWQSEIKRYVEPKWIDIVLISGAVKSRENLWSEYFNVGHHSRGQKVVIITYNVSR